MAEDEQCDIQQLTPRVSREPYPSHSRAMALQVLDYLRRKHPRLNETELEYETAAATGVSTCSLQRFKKEMKEGGVRSPPPKRQRSHPVMDEVDNFDKSCIRRIILSFYERGEIPTIAKVLEKVKEDPVNFPGGETSLRKVVKEIGFRFGKVRTSRTILMERNDIAAARSKYLRILAENRASENPRCEIYLDETWVNQNECVRKCWTTKEGNVGPKVKTGKGSRFIIVHAGSKEGFVPGGLLMFKSRNGNKGDYHDSMNHETFLAWFKNQLLPNIPPTSLIIMDNASYHSKLLNKAPTTCSRKHEIIQWLEENNVPHDPKLPKAELLQIISQNKARQVYIIDKIANDHGHKVARLPPYHCHLNPIELIWAQVKSDVRMNNSNGNQTMKRVEQLTKEAVAKVTARNWLNCVNHTHQIEQEYIRKDRAVNHLYESSSFVINIESSSSDEEYV